MPAPDADVIIIGAGPAGSTAAYHLAIAGVSVLILEKSVFPRYKVCGSGLTHKIIPEIPFDISDIIQTTIRSIRFSMRFGDVFTRSSENPLMYCTMRPELDEFLLLKAVQAGARLETEMVREVRKEENLYTVVTDKRNFTGRVIIGSDGASGIVSKIFSLRDNIQKGLAWEAEVKADEIFIEKYKGTVFLDWGTFPGGYAWVFPKSDHFSVGVGGPAHLSKQMMPYYLKFMKSLEIFNIPADLNDPAKIPGTTSLKSWPIPVKRVKGAFHSDGVMVTGDAAGLTDPLTGEGIYYAVRSGKLAAEAAIGFLQGICSGLGDYSQKINDELMPELLEAEKINNIFNIFPKQIHHFVRDNERGWRAFGKILRGERWYADVRNGFGRWKVLWNFASSATGFLRKVLEMGFLKKGFH